MQESTEEQRMRGEQEEVEPCLATESQHCPQKVSFKITTTGVHHESLTCPSLFYTDVGDQGITVSDLDSYVIFYQLVKSKVWLKTYCSYGWSVSITAKICSFFLLMRTLCLNQLF